MNRAKINTINTGRCFIKLKEYDDKFDEPARNDQPAFKQFQQIAENKTKITGKATTTGEYHE